MHRSLAAENGVCPFRSIAAPSATGVALVAIGKAFGCRQQRVRFKRLRRRPVPFSGAGATRRTKVPRERCNRSDDHGCCARVAFLTTWHDRLTPRARRLHGRRAAAGYTSTTSFRGHLTPSRIRSTRHVPPAMNAVVVGAAGDGGLHRVARERRAARFMLRCAHAGRRATLFGYAPHRQMLPRLRSRLREP